MATRGVGSAATASRSETRVREGEAFSARRPREIYVFPSRAYLSTLIFPRNKNAPGRDALNLQVNILNITYYIVHQAWPWGPAGLRVRSGPVIDHRRGPTPVSAP